jgi:3D-(3,5/4)-trihydroxycyclohexane-1,2-dione acylhydrolase (decyclizing)
MGTIRLTMAQALVRYLAAQQVECDGKIVALFGGVWAIFGHGNVAGIGEALHAHRAELPTWRAHNEQAMALAAIAYAKATHRRRMMACTTSIGPGATNMVTAASLAHVDRLPVLLLPGDVFASRRPDPVLQQVESFGDGTISANDCFRPVSRYFDRITRPEQLLTALPRALSVLSDPAECGPVTLALCQDVQAEAYDYPEQFFARRILHIRRQRPDEAELAAAAELLRGARSPLIIAGGGVHDS